MGPAEKEIKVMSLKRGIFHTERSINSFKCWLDKWSCLVFPSRMPASKVEGSDPEIAVIHRGGAREGKEKTPEGSRKQNGMRYAVHLRTENKIAHLCSKCMHWGSGWAGLWGLWRCYWSTAFILHSLGSGWMTACWNCNAGRWMENGKERKPKDLSLFSSPKEKLAGLLWVSGRQRGISWLVSPQHKSPPLCRRFVMVLQLKTEPGRKLWVVGVYSPGLLPGQLGWALGSLIWWVQPVHSRGDFVVPSNPTRSVRRGSPVEPSIPKGRTDCHTILPFKHSLRTTTTNQKLPLKAESKFFTERNVHFAFCAVFTFSGRS